MSPAPRPFRPCPSTAVLLITSIAAILLASCGSGPREPLGDPGGVPIQFTVDFTWQYLDTMGTLAPSGTLYVGPPPAVVYVRPGVFGPRVVYAYGPAGVYPSPYYEPYYQPYYGAQVAYDSAGYQDVFLLAGNGPAEDQVFHQKIYPGRYTFEALITRGRTVTLSLQAAGNRNGWKVLGHLTAADRGGGRVHLRLDATGSALQVFPPPGLESAPTTESSPNEVGAQVAQPAPAASADHTGIASPAQPLLQPPASSAAAAPAAPSAPAPAPAAPVPADTTSDEPVPTQPLTSPPAPAAKP